MTNDKPSFAGVGGLGLFRTESPASSPIPPPPIPPPLGSLLTPAPPSASRSTASSAPSSTMSGAALGAAISLEQVAASGISVAWEEAVAVVEEFCALVKSPDGSEPPVPEPTDVFITSAGGVALGRKPGGAKGADRAGRLLHTLLATTNAPVALRLLVTQATSSGMYESLDEFARALAYFGSPDRAPLIRDLYERCRARLASMPTTPSAAPASKAPPVVRRATPARRRVALAVASALALATLGGAAMLVSREGGTPSLAASVPSRAEVSEAVTSLKELGQNLLGQPIVRPVSAPVAPAPEASRRTARRTPLGAARASGASPETGVSGGGVGGSGVAGGGVGGSGGGSSGVRDGGVAAGIASAVTVGGGLSVPGSELPTPIGAAPTGASRALEATAGRAGAGASRAGGPRNAEAGAWQDGTGLGLEDAATYSIADRDVRPPIMYYPQLPPFLELNTPPGAVNAMELLVTPEGNVDRVQMMQGPSRMPDMMLLSSAKTWRFRPALKNGQPVWYRTNVRWTGGF